MLRTFPKNQNSSQAGHLDLSFREAENWSEFLGCKGLTLLMGDEDAGPYVYFSSSEPMQDEMKVGIAHGHDADTWRISIQGTTNVGKYAYTESQFRFQDGGISYPGDNFTWGPDGGYGIVIFADRRGFPVRPVDPNIAAKAAAAQQPMVERMGIDLQHPCPGAPAIRTTIGETKHGHLDSSFETATNWPEIAPGTRAAISVLGERTVGPVLVMLRSDPGALVVPAGTLAAETLHIVVDGSCEADSETRTMGDFWVKEAGQQSEVVAGANGMSHALLISNRQAVAGFDVSRNAATWADNLRSTTSSLISQL
jgi:hypothetical protein